MNRFVRQAMAVLVVALVGSMIIVVLRGGRSPVPPRMPGAGGDRSSLHERIRISMAAADSRNAAALALCEREIDTILAREFGEIARRGDIAAAELAGYRSCCGIIVRLAQDSVFGGDRAAAHVDQRIGGALRPALRVCSRELDTALARFDRSLAESTVTLAAELAQARGKAGAVQDGISADIRTSGDVEQALRNLGLSAAGLGVGLSLDIWAILNSRLAHLVVAKATGTATAALARPAAAAAAEMTVAAADGPLPIGDVIAIAGGLWTAYDIHATRAAFRSELKTSLDNAIADMQRDLHDQILARIRGSLDAHRRVQDSIRTASTDNP